MRHDLKPGVPCWIDLSTSDRQASVAFYTALFGWDVTEPNPDFGDYATFLHDGQPVAGVMSGPEGPDCWSTYLCADDVRAAVARAEELGGESHFPPHDVGDLGAMGFLTDPTGAVFGIWQPGTHRGFDLKRGVSAPFWHELWTRDLDAAVAFYTRLFGLQAQVQHDSAEMRYTTLSSHPEDFGGIGISDASRWMPAEAPAHWAVYFRVEDAEATARRIEELGGRITQAPVDTPYGWMGGAVDPQGTAFRFMVPKPM